MATPDAPAPVRICRHGDPKCVTLKTAFEVIPLCDKCIEDGLRGIVGIDIEPQLRRSSGGIKEATKGVRGAYRKFGYNPRPGKVR